MNKLYRLTLSFILIFGWLFLTPAYSDDPLSLAEQEIQDLNDSIADLNYKDEFVSLIGLAEQKYDDAVYAKQAMDNASSSYNNALQSEATALSEKEAAQLAVDEQTTVVTSKLTNKNTKQEEYNSAQIALNAHIATYGNGGNQGVYFRIYPLSRMGNYAYLAEGAGLMCHGSISTFDTWAGSGAICGLSQNIIGIFEATVTVPEGINAVKFAGYTDDGFRLYVDGVLTTADQWQEQGVAWSPYTQWFDTSSDKTLNLQAWWYNGGGPGSIHVGVGTYEWWSGIPSNWLSYGQGLTQEQIDQRAALQTDRNTKYAQYQTALSEYNTENNTLSIYNQTLTTKITTHNTAVTNTTNALTAKNNAISTYDQSIIDLNSSIDDAWEYYEEQMAREIAIALAQAAAAAANQPTPEPSPEPSPEPTPGPSPEPSPEPEPTEEATPEPTPEPSPEQTEPSDPTPTPEPETTDEPKPEPTVDPEPTPEPSPEPSPQPSDIDPEPTPEPEPTPSEPSEESPDNTIIEDEELAALVPEKGEGTTEDLSGVIANLTSKDNKLITLTSEQVAAVSQTLKALTTEAKVEVAQDLGIKASEVEKIAEVMKENPALATAFVEFNNRAESAGDSTMPYTLADATTEVQTEAFLADPVGALTNIDIEKVLDPSEWGKDMTDDQREKAQEVVIPVVLVANVVSSVMSLRRV